MPSLEGLFNGCNMKDRRVTDLRYTITWRNPYKPRPAGLPKILCSSPFEEELTLPLIIASNWGLSAWAIGIYFEHPKPKRKMDEEKRASMRRKRMQTRRIFQQKNLGSGVKRELLRKQSEKGKLWRL
jgi:hypothetical protein